MKTQNNYLSKFECVKIAQNCVSLKDFFEKDPRTFYIAASKNWLNDMVFNDTKSIRKPHGYWTFEKVKAEAAKFLNLKEFQKNSSAYGVAWKNKWLEAVSSHMTISRKIWTFEKCLKEAKKICEAN